MSSTQRRPLAGLGIAPVAVSLLLAACSAGGDDDSSNPGGTPQPINLASLSGVVVGPGGTPLAGAVVSLGQLEVETDSTGAFVMGFADALPSANLVLTVDGEPAQQSGQSFGVERFAFTVDADDDRPTVPFTIVLPDRKSPDGANAALTINGLGQVLSNVFLNPPGPGASMLIPSGTAILIDGVPATTGLEVSIVPVPGEELGHPLPSNLAPAGFAAIGPTQARFIPPGGLPGLDISLPNINGFPNGALVDIWAYDEGSLGWVNRSAQTGIKGTVVSGGAEIIANGVAVEGGIYTGALVADNGLSTTITGSILDFDDSPVRDATVATEFGQVAQTDADGKFTLTGIPAFDYTAALTGGGGVPVSVRYRISTAAEDGAIVVPPITIPSIGIVPSATTVLSDSFVDVPDAGALVGVLTGEQEVPGTPVTLVGPAGTSVVPVNSGNQFFVLGLEPGFYTASTVFTDGGSPVYASTQIDVGLTGTVTLSPEGGTGTGTVTVFVGAEDGSGASPLIPSAGAQVLLFGTDVGSSQGVLRTTDLFGNATFEGVDGPYTVSAEALVDAGGTSRRATATVFGVTPSGGSLKLALDATTPVSVDATLSGTIGDLPSLGANESLELLCVARGDVGGERFAALAPVDEATGAYSLSVPSNVLLDLALLRFDSALAGADSTLSEVTPLPATAGPVAAAGSATFDASATAGTAIQFDELVTLTLTSGIAADSTANIELDLTLPGAGSPLDTVRLPLPLGEISNGAGTLALPGVDALVAADFGVVVRAREGADPGQPGERSVGTEALLATTSSLALTLDLEPVLLFPTDGSSLTVAELASAGIGADLGEAESSGGLVRLRLAASGAELALGVNESVWTLWAPADELPPALPTLPMPMWVAGSSVTVEASTVRSLDGPLDLDEFALDAPVDALLGLASTEVLASGRSAGVTVTVTADPD